MVQTDMDCSIAFSVCILNASISQNGNFGSSQEMALRGAGLSIGANILNMGPQESAFISAVLLVLLHYFQMQPIVYISSFYEQSGGTFQGPF